MKSESDHYQANLEYGIEIPEKCEAKYVAQKSGYQCQFRLKNKTQSDLYLNFTSSFGKFMKQESNIHQIKSGEQLNFQFLLRPPNQIYPQEFIGVSFSNSQSNSYLSFIHQQTIAKKVMVSIDQSEINCDSEIDKILQEQSESVLKSAQQLLKANNFKNAKETAQEAYVQMQNIKTLYRMNLKCLIVIAESMIGIGQIQEATKTVDILFYSPQHPCFPQAQLIKVETALLLINTMSDQQKMKITKKLILMIKHVKSSDMLKEEQQNRCNSVMAKLHDLKKHLHSNHPYGKIAELIQKATEKIQQNQSLKMYFPKKENFQAYLNNLVVRHNQNVDETPQYALDPISYQIFKDPVITPFGVSYQKQSFISFHKKNEGKDPFTRNYIDPSYIIPNNTLKNLVRNHPNLLKWIKFQEQTTKM